MNQNPEKDENSISQTVNEIPLSFSKSKFLSSQGLSHSHYLSSHNHRPLWKKKIAKFLDSAPVLIFMSILTIYALFSSDIQAAFLRIEVDYAFNIIQCILVGIFTLEWILNIIAKVDYIFSFFFWLDLIATISLIQDIDWVMNPVLGYGSARQKSYKSSVQAAKAMSKVSSASRATRVLRVIRIVRLIRMVKLYKSVVTARENQEKMKKKEKELDEIRKNEKITEDSKDHVNLIRGIRSESSASLNGKSTEGDGESQVNSENNLISERNDANNNNNDSDKRNLNIKVEKKNGKKNNNENKDKNINNNNVDKDNNINNKNSNGVNKENIDNKINLDNKKGNNNLIKNGIAKYSKNGVITISEQRNTSDRDASEANNLIMNSNLNSNIQKVISPTITGDNLRLKKDENSTNNNNTNNNTNHIKEKNHNLSKSKEMSSLGDYDEEDLENLVKESKISKIISDSLTQKVIILILVLLIVFPLLSDDFYASDSSVTYELIAQIISASYDLFQSSGKIIQESVLRDLFDPKFPALNITYNGTIIINNTNYSVNYFRYKEVKTVFSANGQVSIVYSVLKETKLTGLLNIFQTIFVCIMLSGAAILFENDARNLVLNPLEIMIEIVENVAKDPINAKNVENLQTGVKAMLDQNEEQQSKEKDHHDEEENYEVSVIKAAIIKISALLAISFGEAGGEIIKKNITSGQDLNPRLKGKKKTAIFGFCDIRQFEEINLALEEKTILLINEIADIIHSSVDRFGGATNKNIGESFLNVWKFYNETPVRDAEGNVTMERKDNLLEIDPTNPMVEITADESVCACLRCIKKINKSYNILSYGKNEEILKRIPNFKLNMGFGLHIGYGIEGAVGSTYKIDASYLSPNVNIAARLETATRQFGLSLLVSGPLYQLLSEDMKRRMRFVDCVNVKGSVIPLDLYTIDVNLDLKPQEKKISIMSPKDKRKRYQDKKELFQREIEMVKSVTNIIFEKDSYIELTRTKKTDEFYHEWEEGVKFYKNGYFKQAAEQYEKCLKIDPDDGPAKTLLTYIKNRNYKKPEGWKGVRELTSK